MKGNDISKITISSSLNNKLNPEELQKFWTSIDPEYFGEIYNSIVVFPKVGKSHIQLIAEAISRLSKEDLFKVFSELSMSDREKIANVLNMPFST